jgi:ribonuclease E
MTTEMLITVRPRCRVALVRNGVAEELTVPWGGLCVGNIYKGRVVNIEPAIQSSFIDFGIGRNGFLHVSDIDPAYYQHLRPLPTDNTEESKDERDQRAGPKPPIQDIFRRGQEVLVQIIREGGTPRDNKGPTVSTYLSVAGRYFVLMPGLNRVGVSRKIEDEEQRRRLRELVRELDLPPRLGFIVRTAAVGRSAAELQRDVSALLRAWRAVAAAIPARRAPALLYAEVNPAVEALRRWMPDDVDTVWIDREAACQRARAFFAARPEIAQRIRLYSEEEPLFHKYGIHQG